MKNLINEEMTLEELSNELLNLGFEDIFEYGESYVIDNKSFDNGVYNVEFDIVDDDVNGNLDIIIKVTDICKM